MKAAVGTNPRRTSPVIGTGHPSAFVSVALASDTPVTNERQLSPAPNGDYRPKPDYDCAMGLFQSGRRIQRFSLLGEAQNLSRNERRALRVACHL